MCPRASCDPCRSPIRLCVSHTHRRVPVVATQTETAGAHILCSHSRLLLLELYRAVRMRVYFARRFNRHSTHAIPRDANENYRYLPLASTANVTLNIFIIIFFLVLFGEMQSVSVFRCSGASRSTFVATFSGGRGDGVWIWTISMGKHTRHTEATKNHSNELTPCC